MKRSKIREENLFGYVVEYSNGWKYEIVRCWCHHGNQAEWYVFGYFNGNPVKVCDGLIPGTVVGCPRARLKIVDHQKIVKGWGA